MPPEADIGPRTWSGCHPPWIEPSRLGGGRPDPTNPSGYSRWARRVAADSRLGSARNSGDPVPLNTAICEEARIPTPDDRLPQKKPSSFIIPSRAIPGERSYQMEGGHDYAHTSGYRTRAGPIAQGEVLESAEPRVTTSATATTSRASSSARTSELRGSRPPNRRAASRATPSWWRVPRRRAAEWAARSRRSPVSSSWSLSASARTSAPGGTRDRAGRARADAAPGRLVVVGARPGHRRLAHHQSVAARPDRGGRRLRRRGPPHQRAVVTRLPRRPRHGRRDPGVPPRLRGAVRDAQGTDRAVHPAEPLPLPEWAAGVVIGGGVTLEGLLVGLSQAARSPRSSSASERPTRWRTRPGCSRRSPARCTSWAWPWSSV